MTKQNKNIIFLLIGAILLFSFKSAPKRKTDIIIDPNLAANLFANKSAQLYDFDPSVLLYTFQGGEYLTLLEDTGIDYKISYIRPGGNIVTGYISYLDVTIK